MIRARLLLPTTVIIALVATALLAVSAGSVFATPPGGVDAAPAAQGAAGITTTAPTLTTLNPSVGPDYAQWLTEGQSKMFTIVLDTLPTGGVAVDLDVVPPADAVVHPSTLTFLTSNWNTPQNVYVAAFDDTQVEDGLDLSTLTPPGPVVSGLENVQITYTIRDLTGALYNSVTESPFRFRVADNDGQVGLQIGTVIHHLVEGQDAVTQSVKLNSQPTDTVVVTVGASPGAPFTIGGTTAMSFSMGTWNIPQTFTITPELNDADSNDETGTIVVGVSSTDTDYAAVESGPIVVSVTDDEPYYVVFDPSPLVVDEQDQNTVAITLSEPPPGNAVVTFTESSDKLNVNPTSVTFTALNWFTPINVGITALDDSDAFNEEVSVSVDVDVMDFPSSAYNFASPAPLVVSIIDNEDAITLSGTSVVVTEGGTGTYTIVLANEPTGNVIISMREITDVGDLLTNIADVTFTTSTYNQPQTVTVTAKDDDIDEDAETVTIAHGITGGGYAGEFIDDVTVTVNDDDTRGMDSPNFGPGRITVAEGNDGAYSLRLESEPTANVAVTMTTDSGRITFSPNPAIFTPNNWDDYRLITAAFPHDDLDQNTITENIRHTANGGDYIDVTYNGRVRSVDNDTRGITISPSPVSITEGSSLDVTVVLGTQPTDNVTVDITENDTTDDISLSTTSLTFGDTTWNTEQTVTITATDDSLDEIDESYTITFNASGGDYGPVNVDLTATVVDDDTAGLTFTDEDALPISSIAATEGGSTVPYFVALSSEPSGNVTVAVASADADEVTVEPTTLTFTVANWHGAQRIRVRVVNDRIDEPLETINVTHTPSGADYGSVGASSVGVNVTDNDERGVILSSENIEMSEGGTRMYSIRLNSQPTGTVTVTIVDPTDYTNVTTNPATIEFTEADWETPQNVTATAAVDADGGDDTATIKHTVSGGDYGSVMVSDVTVTVLDPDVQGVTISPPSRAAIPEGQTATYTIVLTTQPAGTVVINISSGNTSAATVSESSIFFGAVADSVQDIVKWDDPQTITVTAPNNDIDHVRDLTARVSHTVGGTNDYVDSNVTVDHIDFTASDEDMAAVILTQIVMTVTEGGTQPYTVSLRSRPSSGTVVISVTDDHDEVTVNPPSLTFNTTNWNMGQVVTVTNPADDVDEDEEMAVISHTLDSGPPEYEALGSLPQVTATLPDDDTRGYNFDNASLDNLVEGVSENKLISLLSAPTAPLTITITSPAPDDVVLLADGYAIPVQSVDLVFDDTDWHVPQRLQIEAVDDDIDEADMETIIVGFTVSGGSDYDSTIPGDISVTVIDNDTRDVVISPTAIQVTEADTGIDFTVRLGSEPTAPVTIIFSHDLMVGTHENSVTISPASITIDPEDWDADVTITVSAAADADSVGDSGEISLAITGGDYAGFDADEITLTLLDTDEGGVIVSPQSLMITEGSNDTFTVKLNTDPLGSTTVTMSITEWSGDNADNGTLPIIVLPFTGGASGNWDSPQEVIVGSNVDADAVDEVFTVMLTVSTNYDVANPPPSVTVEVTDPDMQGVTFSEMSLNVTEGGASVAYTAVLDTQPVDTDNVLLFIESSRTEDVMSQPTQLDFTKGNWNTAQTVTVTAVDDDYDEDAVEMHTLEHHTISGGDYGPGTPIADIDVLVNDDDVRGVIVSASSVQFIEEAQPTYTIVLESAPLGGTVTITPLSDNTGKITASPTSLTFNDVNWNAAQTVTLSSPHDADTDDETARISHAVAGADYGSNNVTANSVDVEVEDNDMEAVLVTPTTLRFKEGGTATYEVVLETQPSVGQTVTITITDDSAQVRATPDTLEFTRDTWDIAQTVTVQSLTDADELNDIVNIMHAVDNYGPVVMVADTVEATVAEFDIAELLALADLEAPLELTATAGGGFITLRWKAPLANADGRKPTGYQYRYTPLAIEDFDSPLGSGSAWLTARGSTARFVQISGLINLAGYIFQVRSVDGILLAEANAADDLSTMIDTTGIYEHRTKDC